MSLGFLIGLVELQLPAERLPEALHWTDMEDAMQYQARRRRGLSVESIIVLLTNTLFLETVIFITYRTGETGPLQFDPRNSVIINQGRDASREQQNEGANINELVARQ